MHWIPQVACYHGLIELVALYCAILSSCNVGHGRLMYNEKLSFICGVRVVRDLNIQTQLVTFTQIECIFVICNWKWLGFTRSNILWSGSSYHAYLNQSNYAISVQKRKCPCRHSLSKILLRTFVELVFGPELDLSN